MILFFYGQDTYRMRQKLRELKAKFISASLGDTNLVTLEGQKVTFDELVRQIWALPFLAKTRLVIVENLLISKRPPELLEKVADALKKVPQATVLVFVEEGLPDRRLALFKKLAQEKTEEFKLLEPEALRRWLKKEVEARGGSIDSLATSKLIDYLGNDLWRQSNEIDKLLAYNEKISMENIELLVNPQIESDIFKMIEAVANRRLGIAMKELYRLLEAGEHELYILTMIIYQYRNLLVLKDLEARDKSNNRWALAKKAGLHPFVVQKSLAVLPQYPLADLKAIYGKILDFDVRLKTGKIEPRVALELLLFELSAKTTS